MANPTGANAFGENQGTGFQEAPYGHIERLKNLERLAPVKRPPAVGAPRRAQRAAVRGGVAAPTAAAAPISPPPPQMGYQQYMASFWQNVLNTPGASPLLQQYAQEALGGA